MIAKSLLKLKHTHTHIHFARVEWKVFVCGGLYKLYNKSVHKLGVEVEYSFKFVYYEVLKNILPVNAKFNLNHICIQSQPFNIAQNAYAPTLGYLLSIYKDIV